MDAQIVKNTYDNIDVPLVFLVLKTAKIWDPEMIKAIVNDINPKTMDTIADSIQKL